MIRQPFYLFRPVLRLREATKFVIFSRFWAATAVRRSNRVLRRGEAVKNEISARETMAKEREDAEIVFCGAAKP